MYLPIAHPPNRAMLLTVVWLLICVWHPLRGQWSVTMGLGSGGNVQEPPPPTPVPFVAEYVSAQAAQSGFLQSLSPGLQARLRVSYHLSPYFGLDLTMAYGMGLPRLGQIARDGQALAQTQVRASRWLLTPGLFLSLGDRRFSPYLRVGGVLPGCYQIDLIVHERYDQGERWQQMVMEAQVLPGWNGTLGMTYRLARWLSLYYEVEYLAQRARLTESRLLRYEIDGVDRLPSLARFQTDGTFVPSSQIPANVPGQQHFDPDYPLELSTAPHVIRAIGLNLGLVLTFR